ncbi:MAG: methyltransferase domain-containing protein [Polyangiaceae bacterium]
MSDEPLDDEAPPDIPDISSDPEVAPIPELPSEIPPPSMPSEARVARDSDLDVDVDVDVPSDPLPSDPVPSEPGEEIEPEIIPPPRRKRVDTNPATPVARASVPPPPADPPAAPLAAPAPPPPLPREVSSPPTPVQVHDEEEGAKTLRRVVDVTEGLEDDDLDEETRRMLGAPSLDVPVAPKSASQPPRPLSQPPRPVSQPPRPVSQPPRPVSQPPRPASQPPRAPSQPPPPIPVSPPAAALGVHEAEPPTEPWHPPVEGEGELAATSYPPPPHAHEEPEPELPPTSLKPMRIISVAPPAGAMTAASAPELTSPAPAQAEAIQITAAEPSAATAATESGDGAPALASDEAKAEVTPPAAAPGESPEELSDDDFAPESSDALEESDISFPADESDAEAAAPPEPEAAPAEAAAAVKERESEPEIAVEVEEPKVQPPPPPRRDSGKTVKPVTPPSVMEAKEAQRTKQRKAWWEELFGEDFARANAKLKTPQIVHEADFIEESLGVAKGGVVMDLACGGGYHAVELAQRGYGVVGYDLSLYQLAVAADVAQEAGQKLNLLQGDMREMAFEEMFDGVYCWNTSFGYFEEEKNTAVAQRVFRALRPGGMFLLDVANRDFVVANQPAQTWFEGDACVCMDDMSVDFITSRLRVKRSLILEDGRTMECSYSIRLYSLHELGKLLHDVGFRVTEASGHPATPGVFFGASSPRILILAQRP